jgi:hypothetical protein
VLRAVADPPMPPPGENERSRIRLDVYLLLTLVALEAIALARFGDAVAWSDPAAHVLIAVMAGVLTAGLWGLRSSTG